VTTISKSTATLVRLLAIAAQMATLSPIARAADWPSFRAGNWSFERTIPGRGGVPNTVSRTKCTDPAADQASQRAMLEKSGCKFTPLTQSGSNYRYSATCTMAGTTTTSDSVLEVLSDESYAITVDSSVDGDKIHEVLQAHRLGDCPK
jgi:hypothetical protein